MAPSTVYNPTGLEANSFTSGPKNILINSNDCCATFFKLDNNLSYGFASILISLNLSIPSFKTALANAWRLSKSVSAATGFPTLRA